ncbi:MAG: glycosyltransferase [Lachnospiraceae bacterium]|nr:glycosyltransferase [Lachnospiraceae bacterium]
MGKLKISVIIAVYNAETYLEQCIDSVLEQPVQEIEVICVDDGSIDTSLMILEEYQKKDKRIQIYSQNNQFAGVARNKGLSYAQGEYVLFLDADDFLEKDSLLILYENAKKEETDIIVFGHYRYDTENTCVLDSNDVLDRLAWFGNGVKCADEVAPYIFNFTEPCAWNKFYRTKFIRESNISFMSLKNTNDLFFSYMTLTLANRICVYIMPLLYYRVNNKKSLQGTKKKSPMDFASALIELKNKMLTLNSYKKFETSFCNMAIDTCYFNFYSYREKAGFRELYEAIQNFMLWDIQLEGYIPNKYTDQYIYHEMHKVMHLNYEEFEEFDKAEKQILHPYSYFPFWILPKNKNVVIYGAGSIGKSYFFQLSGMKYCKSIKMTDHVKEKMDDTNVDSINNAFADKVDYVILAVPNLVIKEKIEKKLRPLTTGLKVLWHKPIQQEWSWMWKK